MLCKNIPEEFFALLEYMTLVLFGHRERLVRRQSLEAPSLSDVEFCSAPD